MHFFFYFYFALKSLQWDNAQRLYLFNSNKARYFSIFKLSLRLNLSIFKN